MRSEVIRNILRMISAARPRLQRTSVGSHVDSSQPTLKSTLIEEAAIDRGFACQRLSVRCLLVEMSGTLIAFDEMNGPLSSAAGKRLCDEKDLARRLMLEEGLPVARSLRLRVHDTAGAIAFVNNVGFPVVVKPPNLAKGVGIITDIENVMQLRRAIADTSRLRRGILLEKQFPGDDFRFFVVDGRVISVIQRDRPNVVGDGVSTIRQLIAVKNGIRRANRYFRTRLIPENLRELARLKRSGRTLDDVPATGEKVVLRDQSNVSAGGEGIDMTDTVHPGFRHIAARAIAAIPGIRYGGVDILARDISRAPTPTNYIVSEIEFSAAPTGQFPSVGQPRDLAGAVLEFYARQIEAQTMVAGTVSQDA